MPRARVRDALARLALASLCAGTPPAFANDTTARAAAAGGVELLKSDDVRMLQETLTISRELVTVRYRFLNESEARPDDIVSLCFPGQPRRVSPTVLEFHEVNLVPQDRLVVYFYSTDGSESAP